MGMFFFFLLLLSLRLLKQAEKIQRAVFQWADGIWSSIQYILQWHCRMGILELQGWDEYSLPLGPLGHDSELNFLEK